MPHSTLQIIRDEHASLNAILKSILLMIERGPDDGPELFFDVMRAMLFYIDEFPERHHHPKESDLLFPRLVRAAPGLMSVVHRLEEDHIRGEARIRELQHLLLAWELIGDSRRQPFVDATKSYVGFYRDHMLCEETQLLPVAQKVLTDCDWAVLDAAFERDRDPLSTGNYQPCYDRLFTRIVTRAPAPIGFGSA